MERAGYSKTRFYASHEPDEAEMGEKDGGKRTRRRKVYYKNGNPSEKGGGEILSVSEKFCIGRSG